MGRAYCVSAPNVLRREARTRWAQATGGRRNLVVLAGWRRHRASRRSGRCETRTKRPMRSRSDAPLAGLRSRSAARDDRDKAAAADHHTVSTLARGLELLAEGRQHHIQPLDTDVGHPRVGCYTSHTRMTSGTPEISAERCAPRFAWWLPRRATSSRPRAAKVAISRPRPKRRGPASGEPRGSPTNPPRDGPGGVAARPEAFG